jgi:hypothetical protein
MLPISSAMPVDEWFAADLFSDDPLSSGRAVCTVIRLDHIEDSVHGMRNELPWSI